MKKIVYLSLIALSFNALSQNDWNTSTSGQITYTNGKVGIGTSNPSTALAVNGTNDQWIYINPGTFGGIRLGSSGNDRLNVLYRDKATDLLTLRNGKDNGSLAFIVGGSTAERMRISSNGRVGVGTTSPEAILHINGQGGGTSGYKLSNTSESVLGYFANDNTNSDFYFTYANTGGAEIELQHDGDVILGQAGNIGINTDAPNAKLHLVQENQSGLRFERDNHDSYELRLAGSKGLRVYNVTDAKEEMVFDNGNIGIGTNQPADRLHIFSNASGGLSHSYSDLLIEDDTRGMVEILTSNTGIGYFGFADNDDNYVAGIHYLHSDDKMIFKVNDQNQHFMLANGYVGIGTGSPDEKLTVKGKIHSEEVRVDLSVPGPDYVFEPTYDLRSLEETEAYIKENKHLPEVPSAKEMEANGVQLGEMNMLLLKKIEELTLHQIEMMKIIKEQQKEIEELKSN